MKGLGDLLERAGWTAVQAFVGVLAGVNLTEGAVDWKLVLTSAGIAALVAALKVLGVKGSQVTTVVDTAEKIPAVHRWTENTPVGQTSEEIARRVASELARKQ
jgi:hypothetical protein